MKHKLTDNRAYFKPFTHPQFYERWLRHEQSHWLHTELPFTEDVADWKHKLTKEEKEFVTQIFRFFTQGDIDVAEGYTKAYLPYFNLPEVRMMLLGFAAREALHVAAYSHLIETLGLPETTYKAFLDYECMRDKHEYIEARMDGSTEPSKIAENIAVFSAFTEGMQLFSSFIMLLNFSRQGKLRSMGQIIQWSIVDETQHAEGMIELFRTYIKENKGVWNDELKSKIYTIAEKMVSLEDAFIESAFATGGVTGLSKEEVKQYIRYITDRRLISLGLKGIFKVKENPLPWVAEMINAPSHTNFFENKSSDYAKGATSGTWDEVWA